MSRNSHMVNSIAAPIDRSKDLIDPSTKRSNSVADLLIIAVWVGTLSGLVEGIGLLLFQRINWQRWGITPHVTASIVWISPIVDVALFLIFAFVVATFSGFRPAKGGASTLVFILVLISIYNWARLMERLTYGACVLLSLGAATFFARIFRKDPDRYVRFFSRTAALIGIIWLLSLIGIGGGKRLIESRELATLTSAPAGAPNVLIILVDTLRADHLSSYGYGRSTPNLDRLASQGVLFENAISACSWTLPSHASLITGRYPADHGMQGVQPAPWMGWGNHALHRYPTIGEALQRRGYRTAAFSGNQTYFTSNVGLGRGFIHFEDYFQSPADMFLRTQFGREFHRFYLHDDDSVLAHWLRSLGLNNLLDDRKRADEVNREALAWIARDQRPFFAFLNYIDVHDATYLQWFHALPPWGMANRVDQYDSAVSYVDGQVGQLMQELKRRGLGSNTLVIFTSDHGEALGDHSMQYHGIALYRDQIHVPLFISYPGHVASGVRIARPVSNASIAATIMATLGETGKVFPGDGLNHFWEGKSSESSAWDPVSQLAGNSIFVDPEDKPANQIEPTAIDGSMQSILTSQWHLVVHETRGSQIFDWVHDPGELRDLSQSAQGRKASEQLAEELQTNKTP